MRSLRPLILVALVVGIAPGTIAGAQEYKSGNTAAPSDVTSLVKLVEQAERDAKPSASYQVIREYRLGETGNSRANSNVVAQVDYVHPNSKTYAIQTRTGSGRGEQVVKKILEHESALASRGSQASSAAITEDNYTFTNLGESTLDGQACYLLGLVPKRKQQELIAGRAWVDKSTFLIRRIEGQLAKSPSWWLKSVKVKLDFSDISGTWLQTDMEATADVRIIGSQTIQARTIDFRSAGIVAERAIPQTRRNIRRGIPAELLFSPATSRP
jgi:Outer membrane lipoprotein-sorting protein